MKEVLIRDFIESDIEKILDYREESGRISFPELTIDRERAKGYIIDHVKKYPGTLKVAVLNGKTVGFIRFHIVEGSFGDYGLIDIIFVEEIHRRQGIGNLLLQEAEKWFRSKGLSRIEATITNTNIPSINFFKSRGYIEKRTIFEKKL
ncbi:MAG: GNAT family N-acetyltransferase [Candidatus Aenigmatarchaeota archaeon]